jgi:hypothetical protein
VTPRQGISNAVLERLLTSLADAYVAVDDSCKGDFWRSLMAICDTIATGRVGGKMVLRVDFSSRWTKGATGVHVDPLRYENVVPDLRLEYEDVAKKQEEEFGNGKASNV